MGKENFKTKSCTVSTPDCGICTHPDRLVEILPVSVLIQCRISTKHCDTFQMVNVEDGVAELMDDGGEMHSCGKYSTNVGDEIKSKFEAGETFLVSIML